MRCTIKKPNYELLQIRVAQAALFYVYKKIQGQ